VPETHLTRGIDPPRDRRNQRKAAMASKPTKPQPKPSAQQTKTKPGKKLK
jgi:hypothetical protein